MNKSKLKESRKCESCGVTKPISKFRKRRKDYGGGTYADCKVCFKKMKAKLEAKSFANDDPIPEFDPKAPVDLSFLHDIGGFTETEVKKLLFFVNIYTKEPHFMSPNNIFVKFFHYRTPKNCRLIIQEFTEADRAGVSFEDAWKTRKFRKDGLKQLAGKK